MNLSLKDVSTVLSVVLVLLLFLRRRSRRSGSLASERDLVTKAVDSVEKAYRVWNLVFGMVIVAVVVGLAFFDSLIADILSITVIVMVIIGLWAPRSGRESVSPGGKSQ